MNHAALDSYEIRVNGLRTPILEGRSAAADPHEAVVCVHGNPGSSQDWRELAGAVAAQCRVVALDMPGFGKADKPDDFPCTVQSYAGHLGAALQSLQVRRAHLVLHDFGGAWGLDWAMTQPQALASLTLIDTGYLPGLRWHRLARIWRTPLLGELFQALSTRKAFHALLQRGMPRRLPETFLDTMYDHYDAATRRAVLRLYRVNGDLGALSASQAAGFAAIRCPTLVIWGRYDPYLGAEFATRQREVFPDAEVHVLEDSGHWPFVDNPQAVQDLVLPFLRRHSAGQNPNFGPATAAR